MLVRRIVVLLVALGVGCGGPAGSGEQNDPAARPEGAGGSAGSPAGGAGAKLARLDIAGARTLFIATPGTAASLRPGAAATDPTAAGSAGTGDGASPATTPSLYRVGADGTVAEVARAWSSADGTPVAEAVKLTPTCIWNASSDYVVVNYAAAGAGHIAVLARKSDGAAFTSTASALNQLLCPQQAGPAPAGADPLQSDAAGNLYVRYTAAGGMGAVARIDVSDPASPREIRLTPDTDSVWTFVVNGAGDLYYAGNLGTPAGSSVSRVRPASGSPAFVDYSPYGVVWVGLDGRFYRTRASGGAMTGPGPAQTVLVRLDVGATVTEVPVATWSGVALRDVAPKRLGGALVWLNNVVVTTGSGPPPMAGAEAAVVRLTAMDEPPAIHPLAASSYRATSLGASSAIWFVAGDGGTIQRWTPAGMTSILTGGAFDVFALAASGDDEAALNALRMSDGRKVVARVGASGAVTIADVGPSPEVVAFQRID